MNTYTFNRNQLYKLLYATGKMADEYREQHGYDRANAYHAAAWEALEGLDAERELFALGEIEFEKLSQTLVAPESAEDVRIVRERLAAACR